MRGPGLALALLLALLLAGCASGGPKEGIKAPPEPQAAEPLQENAGGSEQAAAGPAAEPPQAAATGGPAEKPGPAMGGRSDAAARRVSHTEPVPAEGPIFGTAPPPPEAGMGRSLKAEVPVDGRSPWLLAIAVLALAPGLFWLWFFIRRDKLAPGARRLVVRTFFYGMLIALPVASVTSWVAHPLAAVAASLLVPTVALGVLAAPVIEEGFKFLVVRGTVFNRPEFGEPAEGMVYAAAAALGFATIENAAYLFSAYMAPESLMAGAGPEAAFSALLVTFALRALLTVPGHALWSSMWGYALGVAKGRPAGSRMGPILVGLLLAMGLHAAYNALVSATSLGALVMLVLVLVMWWLFSRLIFRALTFSTAG